MPEKPNTPTHRAESHVASTSKVRTLVEPAVGGALKVGGTVRRLVRDIVPCSNAAVGGDLRQPTLHARDGPGIRGTLDVACVVDFARTFPV